MPMSKKDARVEGENRGYEAAVNVDVGIEDTELFTHFERGEGSVELRDKDDNTIVEWRNEDLDAAIEDGFLPANAFIMGKLRNKRSLHQAAFDYAVEVGLFPTIEATVQAALEAEENSRQYSPFEFLANEINSSKYPDEVWEAYDAGVYKGAMQGAKERSTLSASKDLSSGLSGMVR